MMGKWISISGIDGSGKTSLGDYLGNRLKNSLFIKLPYYDWVREALRIIGNNKPMGDPYSDLLLFAISSKIDCQLIISLLRKYEYVITQRSWLDNFPYRLTQGFSLPEIIKVMKANELIKPHLIIFIKTDYRIAYNRIKNEKGDKYETLSFMKILEKKFNYVFNHVKMNKFPIEFKNTRFEKLDGNKGLDELKKRIGIIINNFTSQVQRKSYKY